MTTPFAVALSDMLEQTTWNIATLASMFEAVLQDADPSFATRRRDMLMHELMGLVPDNHSRDDIVEGLALQFELGARLLREAVAKAKKAKVT